MCLFSTPKPPKISQPRLPKPAPVPEAPEKPQSAPVAGDDRRRRAGDADQGTRQRATVGRRRLRIDLNLAGQGAGLNLPA